MSPVGAVAGGLAAPGVPPGAQFSAGALAAESG